MDMVGIRLLSGRIGMTEAERRVIIDTIDDLQEIDEVREDPYMQRALHRLQQRIGVGPDFQEDGE